MKQRYFKRQFTDSQSVDYFVSQGIPLFLAEALNARGISAADFPYYFGNDCFHSPFEMKNMQDAVETISYILEEGGCVLICGDYDADGLTASSLLSLFFTDNGIDNDVLIPTREKGYGLHADMVMEAFEKKFYDLIITVDCGISNREEVATIQEELGAEIIVTDHHELPDILPDCLCVNPKMGYPFANLSGSGVAWKLVEALAGREVAARYSDLAMIGTIGDLMPMQDENRSLVKLGLANWNHKGLQKICELSRCPEQLTATDIAMKIAPMINAAGRMGDPLVALRLLLSRDKVSVALADKLYQINEQRKVEISQLTEQCDAACSVKDIRENRLAFLYGENWQQGLLGIVASRYKEKFGYPAVVLTKDANDVYVGSARGVDSLDLFDAFNHCKDLLVKFGGHKAAVGFSVTEENLLPLKQRLAQYWQDVDDSFFEKVCYYDIELEKGCNIEEMYDFSQKLQPSLPQDKLLFHVRDVVQTANTFGKVKATNMRATLSSGLEIVSFGKYAEYVPFIKNGADIEAVISLARSTFNGNVVGIVEDLSLCNSVCFDQFYKLNFLKNFQPQSIASCTETQVSEILRSNSVVAVFDDYETFLRESQRFCFDDFYLEIFFENSLSTKSVVISPTDDYCFGKYQNVVSFCKQGMVRILPPNTKYFAVEAANQSLYQVQLDRNVCATVFSKLKNKSQFDSVHSVFDKYLLGKISYEQYLVALRVFEQLDFIQIVNKYTVNILPAEKSDLSNSSIYRCFDNKGN